VQLLLSTAQAHQATLVIATHDARVMASLSADVKANKCLQTLKLSRPASLSEGLS
jgi:ABC-type lipoprotein export system ATPase subunit